MECITNVKLTECSHSNFIKPLRLHYTQNGIPHTRDIIKIHSSVAILIFNATRNVFVFVRQFRAAAYLSSTNCGDQMGDIDTKAYPTINGFTIELCAGIMDKGISEEETAKEEILEECGYDVPLHRLQRIIQYKSSLGISGDHQTLFYAEVTDDMKVLGDGRNPQDDERIQVVEMSTPQVREYISQECVSSPASFMYAINWFILNKGEHLKSAQETLGCPRN